MTSRVKPRVFLTFIWHSIPWEAHTTAVHFPIIFASLSSNNYLTALFSHASLSEASAANTFNTQA